jgi:hypothetical protein
VSRPVDQIEPPSVRSHDLMRHRQSDARALKPYSLHNYYNPGAVLVDGRLAMSSLVVLAAFATVAIGGAFARFLRRDIP